MYRISVIITRKGLGTTLIDPFYLNKGENGVNSVYDATRAAIDIIDPFGIIMPMKDTEVKITVS